MSLLLVGSEEVVQVAVSGVPWLSVWVPQPEMVVPPTLKLTVPVGMPDPLPVTLTVAVKVTDWPNTDVPAEDVTAVLVEAWFTAWVKLAEVLPVKFVSPLYVAVTVWELFESEVIGPLVAVPPDRLTGGPKLLPSIANWTVPVRVPEPGATALTVAVKVTNWPKTEGLAEEATVVVVEAWFTSCESADEVLPVKFVSPP